MKKQVSQEQRSAPKERQTELRKPYQAPKLVEYGSIRDLTLGSKAAPTDGAGSLSV